MFKFGKNYFILKILLIFSTVLGDLSSQTKSILAQITADESFGGESAIVIPFTELIQLIQGGAIRGENLFQSFQDFNIQEGQNIIITNPDGINNLVIRVTGSNPSQILGALNLLKADSINNLINNLPNLGDLSNLNLENLVGLQDLGTANLFFLNPNGILFGENASINVSGSFIATTANQINFADGTSFSANLAQSSPLLTVSTPVGLQFTQPNPQPITVQGQYQELTNILQSIDSASELRDFFTPPSESEPSQGGKLFTNIILERPLGLNVLPNRTLALVGGDVTLDGGSLSALGGRIEVGSLSSEGNVSLTPKNNGWQLGYESIESSAKGNIQLLQLASINPDRLTQGKGEVQINGKTVNILDESVVISLTSGSEDGGDVNIEAQEINLVNGAIISTGTVNPSLFGGEVSLLNSNSGNISLNTDQLTVKESAFMGSLTIGSEGRAGDVTINATDTVNIIEDGYLRGVNFSDNLAQGNGGEIFIKTNKLNVLNSGEIANETELGKGGNIRIEASDSIVIDGFFSVIFNDTVGKGDAGDINITTGKLIIKNQGVVSAESERIASGRGGDIIINAKEFIDIEGDNTGISSASGNLGDAGNIQIITKDLDVKDNARISNGARILDTLSESGDGGELTIFTETLNIDNASITSFSRGRGDAGNININANSLTINNQGQINTLSEGLGNAGNITLNINNSFTATDGNISANANQAGGGEIKINAQNIRLRGDSDIRTNVNSGAGDGGNITITADSIINFNDSDIFSFARDGRGGDIRLNTPVFFGDGYQPSDTVSDPNILDGNGRVDLNATGAVSGAIIIPDLTYIQNNLVQLPESLINPESLIANTCVVPDSRQQGTFIIKGAGGLPTSPGKSSISPYPTGTVQPLPDSQPDTINDNQSWQKGDQMIEPQGVFKTTDGKLILSRQCP